MKKRLIKFSQFWDFKLYGRSLTNQYYINKYFSEVMKSDLINIYEAYLRKTGQIPIISNEQISDFAKRVVKNKIYSLPLLFQSNLYINSIVFEELQKAFNYIYPKPKFQLKLTRIPFIKKTPSFPGMHESPLQYV